MTLRTKIGLTSAALRFGGGILLLMAGTGANSVAVAGCGIGWMLLCGPFVRQVVLPLLYSETTCPGCRRSVPLVGRWKCGSHYIDHRDRHILAFHCNHGHRLEGFDCPRCRATILVQSGDRQLMRHGTAIRLRTSSQIADSSGLLLGHDRRGKEVRLPERRLSWHMAITGGTGRGKSTLLANLACQMAGEGRGFTILDPGGDLARNVLQQIPPHREADTLYLDVSDRRHPFPLNILSAPTELEQAVLTEELLGVFERLHGSSWGPLLEHQLRMALRAVMQAGGTLRDVYGMFVDPRTRTRIIGHLRDPDVRAFWTEEFPTIPAMRHSAVTNKLTPLISHPVLGPVIGAKDCLLDTDRTIAQRKIVLVNLASGSPADDVTTLLGTFLVQKIIAAAFRQGSRPAEQRVRHVLIVDEFQRFMHRAASFDQILAESRKYKLSLMVANQFVEQLSPPVRAALFGNVGCLTAFRVGHRDARVLQPEFSGAVAEDLLELGLGECLARIGTDWTMVRTPRPQESPRAENDPSGRIIAANRRLIRTSPLRVRVRQGRANEAQQPPEDSDLVQ